MAQRRAEIYSGTHLDWSPKRTTVGELLDGVLKDNRKNGREAKRHEWVEGVIRKHLRPVFGPMKATNLRYDHVDRYIERRQNKTAANATINRELALLRRTYNLGREAGKVAVVPLLPKNLEENNIRKGFFERDEFTARWDQVDLVEGVVRLQPGETKNEEARVIPLGDELRMMLSLQFSARQQKWPDCPWVFSRQGRPIRDFRDAWDRACKEVGLIDLRRTGVRNLIRAGVPERVAMAISGHKTRAVFDRYNIVSERDLHDAARKLNTYIQAGEAERSGDRLVTISIEAQTERKEATACKLLN